MWPQGAHYSHKLGCSLTLWTPILCPATYWVKPCIINRVHCAVSGTARATPESEMLQVHTEDITVPHSYLFFFGPCQVEFVTFSGCTGDDLDWNSVTHMVIICCYTVAQTFVLCCTTFSSPYCVPLVALKRRKPPTYSCIVHHIQLEKLNRDLCSEVVYRIHMRWICLGKSLQLSKWSGY